MYKCPYCDEKTNTINTLKIHVRHNHLGNEIYCPYCNIQFNSIQKLRNHLIRKNDRSHMKIYFLIARMAINKTERKFLFQEDE